MDTHDKPNAAEIGWNVTATRYLFESPWYRLRQDVVALPQGQEITYSYVEHPGAVFVVPQTGDGKLVLIQSYRYPIDGRCWEVPSGSLGDGPETDREAVARQELFEEIGGRAAALIDLGSCFMANGFAQYKVYFFLAKGVTMDAPGRTEITEKIERVERYDVSQVLDMIASGVVNDGESALALLRAVPYLDAATRAVP